MPENDHLKPPRPPLRLPPPVQVTRTAYAELRCKTNFSFLTGASHPDELVQRAVDLSAHALAVTDVNSLAGVVRAHTAAKQVGLKLLVGAEVIPQDGLPVVLLATDRTAYGRLSRLLTLGRRRAPKGECELTCADIADHAEGLLAGVILPERGGSLVPRSSTIDVPITSEQFSPSFSPRSGGVSSDGLNRGEKVATGRMRGAPLTCNPRQVGNLSCAVAVHLTNSLRWYRDVFGDRCYALLALHHGPNDRAWLEHSFAVTHRAGVPLVACNDVHYHVPRRRYLHDVVTAIRHRCTVAELGLKRFPNGERYLKSPEQMRKLFANLPEAVARTIEVAERCDFSLDELRYEYPEELCPPGKTLIGHLRELTEQGARRRYTHGIPDKVRDLIEHELRLIEKLHYESYFLTVWDLVTFARGRGILCQGRGSAANSAVCYCLGVTSVDPHQIDLLFERFISEERNEAPDIDIDFEHERREEVIQYVYEKYGRERSGMTATVITYRPRSAIRDIGKALGLSLDRVDGLAKAMDHYSSGEDLEQRFRERGFDAGTRIGRQLIGFTRELLGFPRHLAQHVGGLVITHRSLCEMVPIENAAMEGRTVIQWDKDDLDDLGILKVDCLALGMLSALRKCFDLLAQHYDRRLTLASIPQEDSAVYEMITAADTVGLFQVESRAQMAMHPRLRPRTFYDLVIAVAIVRPGPIQGDMVNPYLRRRAGGEPVEYADERIRAVLPQDALACRCFRNRR